MATITRLNEKSEPFQVDQRGWARLGIKTPYKPRIDWSLVDFSESSEAIALKTGAAVSTVNYNRAKLFPKPPPKPLSVEAAAAKTRQRRAQLINLENGMCQFHKNVPICWERSKVMCEACDKFKARYSYVKKKDRL